MQLTAVARRPDRAVVEPNGFTLVEEDDVAFALSLCREVNRLYGLYQEGRMQASPPLEGALMVSIEMLALVARTVTTGMPAMRITVAGAQLREMMSVVFDADPFTGSMDRSVRDGFRAVLAEMHARPAGAEPIALAEPVAGASAELAPADPAPAGSVDADQEPAEPLAAVAAAEATVVEDTSAEGTADRVAVADGGSPPKRSGLRRLFRRGASRRS